MIRLLLAEDHAVVRVALVQLLGTRPGLCVVGEAANADEVLAQAGRDDIDLILLDLTMPGGGGVPLIEALHRRWPQRPVLVLSMHNQGQVVSRALRAGASGYVAKDSDFTVLCQAIDSVAAGGRYIDPALVDSVVFESGDATRPPHETLSAREAEVLAMIVKGLRLGEIAGRLQLSAKTVSTHKMRLMHKLGVDNNADLVHYAVRHGLKPGAP